jgi:hypothetical protein
MTAENMCVSSVSSGTSSHSSKSDSKWQEIQSKKHRKISSFKVAKAGHRILLIRWLSRIFP